MSDKFNVGDKAIYCGEFVTVASKKDYDGAYLVSNGKGGVTSADLFGYTHLDIIPNIPLFAWALERQLKHAKIAKTKISLEIYKNRIVEEGEDWITIR